MLAPALCCVPFSWYTCHTAKRHPHANPLPAQPASSSFCPCPASRQNSFQNQYPTGRRRGMAILNIHYIYISYKYDGNTNDITCGGSLIGKEYTGGESGTHRAGGILLKLKRNRRRGWCEQLPARRSSASCSKKESSHHWAGVGKIRG